MAEGEPRALESPARDVLERATNPEYWIDLNPQLTLSSDPFSASPAPFEALGTRAEESILRLRREGYDQIDPIFPAPRMANLAQAVQRVVDAGFPTPLAMVYDEFWQLIPALDRLLRPILGGAYVIVPDYWIYHIDGQRELGGWEGHRDDETGQWTLRDDGSPTLLTLWIPLTDATLDNACMYVLPTDRDPNFPDNVEKDAVPFELLPEVRALPADAGSVLIWNQYALHWGAQRSPRARGPRISLAIYVQSADVDPYLAQPLDTSAPLSFEERLAIASRAVIKYSPYIPVHDDVLCFCQAVERHTLGSESGELASSQPQDGHNLQIRFSS